MSKLNAGLYELYRMPDEYQFFHKDDDSMDNGTFPPSFFQDNLLMPKHLRDFRIASLSCRGLASISKRERLVHLMIKHQTDILCLQEKINSNSKEIHQDHTMYWSSDVKATDRAGAEVLARSGRASMRNPEHCNIFQKAREHVGVYRAF